MGERRSRCLECRLHPRRSTSFYRTTDRVHKCEMCHWSSGVTRSLAVDWKVTKRPSDEIDCRARGIVAGLVRSLRLTPDRSDSTDNRADRPGPCRCRRRSSGWSQTEVKATYRPSGEMDGESESPPFVCPHVGLERHAGGHGSLSRCRPASRPHQRQPQQSHPNGWEPDGSHVYTFTPTLSGETTTDHSNEIQGGGGGPFPPPPLPPLPPPPPPDESRNSRGSEVALTVTH